VDTGAGTVATWDSEAAGGCSAAAVGSSAWLAFIGLVVARRED